MTRLAGPSTARQRPRARATAEDRRAGGGDAPHAPWRIVLIGPECTGKTTLAAQLAADYDTTWVPECARQYVDDVGRALTVHDVEPIARLQQAAEDRAAGACQTLVIFDTDLVSTFVYSSHYYGTCPAWVEPAARSRLANLYLLLHTDIAWIADGHQREQPERRDVIVALFRDTLDRFGARVVDVRGDWGTRRTLARSAIDALIGPAPITA